MTDWWLKAGPDLDRGEHQAVLRLLKRGDTGIPGIRFQSMSAGGARAYIEALQRRADEAEREHAEREE